MSWPARWLDDGDSWPEISTPCREGFVQTAAVRIFCNPAKATATVCRRTASRSPCEVDHLGRPADGGRAPRRARPCPRACRACRRWVRRCRSMRPRHRRDCATARRGPSRPRFPGSPRRAFQRHARHAQHRAPCPPRSPAVGATKLQSNQSRAAGDLGHHLGQPAAGARLRRSASFSMLAVNASCRSTAHQTKAALSNDAEGWPARGNIR
jgi:hypothetical protein